MLEQSGLEQRLDIIAVSGKTHGVLRLWKNQISQLERNGCKVTVISSTNREAESLCDVDWSNPTGPIAKHLLEISKHVTKD